MAFWVWLRLTAILLGLPPARTIPTARMEPLIAWVTEGVALEEGTLQEAAEAVIWANHESGGDPLAISPDGKDCALLQMRGAARQGHTCAELMADPVLCVRVWVRWLRKMREVCGGSEVRALGAVSSGKCGGVPRLVAGRCGAIGGCP